MANRYDNTSWSPFPAPATSLVWPHAASCRFTSCPAAAAAFENDALASALLRASMMPPPPSSPTPSSSTTTTTTSSATELSSVHHHDAPAPAPHVVSRGHGSAASKVQAPRCKGSGVSKRKPKPRASRRPPTTYISAGPADFRRMVQEITGLDVPAGAAAACPVASTSWPQDQIASVLPTLDTSASFMLDRGHRTRPSPLQHWEDKASWDGAATAMAATAREETVPEDYPSLFLTRELEMMVSAPAAASSSCPTLESWGLI